MNFISMPDWHSMFVPSINIIEIVLRGSAIYLFIFVLLRLLRRQSGSLGNSDLLVIVLIADAAQNAMASEYKSITEGAILILTIVMWDYALDWLSFRYPKLYRLLNAPPLLLVKDGKIILPNLRKEMISEDELMAQLREQEVLKVVEVKRCWLESNGKVSVIKYE